MKNIKQQRVIKIKYQRQMSTGLHGEKGRIGDKIQKGKVNGWAQKTNSSVFILEQT